MAFVVKYNGSVIHTMAEGEHITLPTNGKIMDGDVEVLDNTPVVHHYLTFKSADAFTIATNNGAKNWDGTLEYSTDASTWSAWDGTAAISSGASGDENVIHIRGKNNTVITGNSDSKRWQLSGNENIHCIGDIRNLLDYEDVENTTLGDYAFAYMFYSAANLVSAPDLPSTTLSAACYYGMFRGCVHLAIGPEELPALTATGYCYREMFHTCQALETTPRILATSITGNLSMQDMFRSCSSLKSLPKLFATGTLPNSSYKNMFTSCSQIKISQTQTAEYTHEYRVPVSGTATDGGSSVQYMFTTTGGTFTGTPSLNTTYYTDHEPV